MLFNGAAASCRIGVLYNFFVSPMSSALYITRLRKELRELKKNPVLNIQALPKENNILEWHYVIEGAKGSPFEGGWYHGVVLFPKEYPYKPPSITMITPNGRFKVVLIKIFQSGTCD